MNTLAEHGTNKPLAIVGIGCHFPGGAHTPDLYWDLMRSGTDATREVPETRWNADKYHDPNPKKVGKMVTRRGGFLSEIDQFDPQFFGISPREANLVDPQQRLLLRTTWEALEDGGISAESLAGTDVGVFIGGFTLDYQLLQNQGSHQPLPLQDSFRHRDDDDDAGEPDLVRLRLPRAQYDHRYRVFELARRGTPCGAKYLER